MRNNLPLPLSSFIGRDRELQEIQQLLALSRLITLTGAGGCGKTRMAIELAAQVLRTGSPRSCDDGVWLVELAALADPALVAQWIAGTLGVREQPGEAILDTLTNFLRDKDLLLVLDNCEHLIEACAQLCAAMLQSCARLQILATSREALRIAGEHVYLVAPLQIPSRQLEHVQVPSEQNSIAELAQNESVRLFVERARAVRAQFALTDANASAVAQICARLDGIPLAIELAAARVKALAPEQIAARLDDAFQLLTGGNRDAPPRHQTMRAALDWSYKLLSEPEQTLFRRLSVFAGGLALEAAEEVCADVGQDGILPNAGHEIILSHDVLDLLTHLVEKSLVDAEERAGETRYRMLELIRQYAFEEAAAAGELQSIQQRHFDFYVDLAEQSNTKLRGPEQRQWLNRMEAEHASLRAALDWSLTQADAGAALRMTGALHWFWSLCALLSEGRMYLGRALALPAADGISAPRAKALAAAGTLAWLHGDSSSAQPLLEQSLAIARELKDQSAAAYALCILGMVKQNLGDERTASRCEAEAVALLRDTGETWLLALALNCSGYVMCRSGLYQAAEPLLKESLTLFQTLGERWATGMPQFNLADIAWQQGRLAEASAGLETSLAIFQGSGDKTQAATSLLRLGLIAQERGDLERALALQQQALVLLRELGTTAVGNSMCLIAGLAAAQGQAESAVRLFAAGMKILGDPRRHADTRLRRLFERTLPTARKQLGEERFALLWAQGRTLTLEEAIAEAESLTAKPRPRAGSRRTRAAAPEYLAGLTAREVEVLRLVAMGLGNQEVADQLVLSRRTVHAHLRSIFSKLDVTTRSAATRAALELKLI